MENKDKDYLDLKDAIRELRLMIESYRTENFIYSQENARLRDDIHTLSQIHGSRIQRMAHLLQRTNGFIPYDKTDHFNDGIGRLCDEYLPIKDIQDMILKYQKCRTEKNFNESDEIKHYLGCRSVQITDDKLGTFWKRVGRGYNDHDAGSHIIQDDCLPQYQFKQENSPPLVNWGPLREPLNKRKENG